MKSHLTAWFQLAIGGLAVALACMATTAEAAEASPAGQVNYARPFEPPTRPAFICAAARRGRAGGLAARLVSGGAGRLYRAHGRLCRRVQAGLGGRLQDDRRTSPLVQGRLAVRRAADTGSTAWPVWATPCTTTR